MTDELAPHQRSARDDSGLWTRLFIAAATLEGISWLALLAGMYFKWIAGTTEAGVKIAGPIHGTLFLVYLAVAWVTADKLRWDPRTRLIALISAFPPLASVIFELWATRRGLFGRRR